MSFGEIPTEELGRGAADGRMFGLLELGHRFRNEIRGIPHVVAGAKVPLAGHLADEGVVAATVHLVFALFKGDFGENLRHLLLNVVVRLAVVALVADEDLEIRVILSHEAPQTELEVMLVFVQQYADGYFWTIHALIVPFLVFRTLFSYLRSFFIPAKAGISLINHVEYLVDSRLRGNEK